MVFRRPERRRPRRPGRSSGMPACRSTRLMAWPPSATSRIPSRYAGSPGRSTTRRSACQLASRRQADRLRPERLQVRIDFRHQAEPVRRRGRGAAGVELDGSGYRLTMSHADRSRGKPIRLGIPVPARRTRPSHSSVTSGPAEGVSSTGCLAASDCRVEGSAARGRLCRLTFERSGLSRPQRRGRGPLDRHEALGVGPGPPGRPDRDLLRQLAPPRGREQSLWITCRRWTPRDRPRAGRPELVGARSAREADRPATSSASAIARSGG